ncbi:MFS general substrate transporter [Clavulina sp. PMI_390]|nr:MFS general substrate transporter [Clavulina sp. PMI_390]
MAGPDAKNRESEEDKRPSSSSEEDPIIHNIPAAESSDDIHYRVYKRRWLGLASLCLLNIASGMCWLWFAPISVTAAEQLGVSLTRITWLSNVVCLIYVPVAFAVPFVIDRFKIRGPSITFALILCIGAWIRYSAVAHSNSPNTAYTLLLIGQIATGITQPWFQVIGPRYSELWFDLKGRTTATAIVAISNPVGCALGELISPLYSDVRKSVTYRIYLFSPTLHANWAIPSLWVYQLLTLAIITTILSLTTLGILPAPPTPPTYAGSHERAPGVPEVARAAFGLTSRNSAHSTHLKMTPRQRVDLLIVTIVFGVLVGAADAFFVLVDQICNPYGYSNNASGNMGGALIISGIIAAIVSAPLFDRVLTHHLGFVAKVLVPIMSVAWLSLIWDVRPNNYAGLYPVFVIIGVCSFILLPVALELGAEITSSAETSSAIFWCVANLLSFVFVEVMNALRAGTDASPPNNMKRSLIFLGAVVMASCFLPVFALEAKQWNSYKNTRRGERERGRD